MRLLALVSAFVLLSGCSVLDFDVSEPIPKQTVPGNMLAATGASIFPSAFTFNVDLQAEAAAHDTGPIGSVHLKSMTLAIDPSSPTQDFDWLHDLQISIESAKQGSALPKVLVAQITAVPAGAKTIDLQVVGNVDVKPYIDEGTKIDSSATATATPQEIDFEGTTVFRVSPL